MSRRTAVAELLHLHRNSVGYRIGQIRDLLGANPLDPEVTLQLQAALTARELLTVLSTGPQSPNLPTPRPAPRPPRSPRPSAR